MKKISTIILILMMLLSYNHRAEASEKKLCSQHNIFHNPLMVDVRRVIISVNQWPRRSNEDTNWPNMLTKDGVGSILQELYHQRFDQGEYVRGCYGKQNQPVDVFDYNDKFERKTFQQISEESKVLSVYVAFVIHDGQGIGYSKDEVFFTLSIHHIRAEERISDFQEVSIPLLLSSKMDEETIRAKIEEYFQLLM